MIGDICEIGLTRGATNTAVRFSLMYYVQNDASTPLTATAITSGTINLNGAAAWVIAAAQKLESLGLLQNGWDSYGGRPLSREARRAAMEAIHMLEKIELPVPGVVLGSAGTVGLEWRRRGKELDVDLGDGSKIEYTLCDRNGDIHEGFADRNEQESLPGLAEWLLNEAPIPPLG